MLSMIRNDEQILWGVRSEIMEDVLTNAKEICSLSLSIITPNS